MSAAVSRRRCLYALRGRYAAAAAPYVLDFEDPDFKRALAADVDALRRGDCVVIRVMQTGAIFTHANPNKIAPTESQE